MGTNFSVLKSNPRAVSLAELPPELRFIVYDYIYGFKREGKIYNPEVTRTHPNWKQYASEAQSIFSFAADADRRRRRRSSSSQLSIASSSSSPIAATAAEANSKIPAEGDDELRSTLSLLSLISTNPMIYGFSDTVDLPYLDRRFTRELLEHSAARVEHALPMRDTAAILSNLPADYRSRMRYVTLDLTSDPDWSKGMSDFFGLMLGCEHNVTLDRLRMTVPAQDAEAVLKQICVEVGAIYKRRPGATPIRAFEVDCTFAEYLAFQMELYHTCLSLLEETLDKPSRLLALLPAGASASFKFYEDEQLLKLSFTIDHSLFAEQPPVTTS